MLIYSLLAHAGYSADQAGLLAMMHAFTNWKWYQERAECNDWSERPGAKYCNWDGVSCNAAGQVVTVQFLKNGSFLTGWFPPVKLDLYLEDKGFTALYPMCMSCVGNNDRQQHLQVPSAPNISSVLLISRLGLLQSGRSATELMITV